MVTYDTWEHAGAHGDTEHMGTRGNTLEQGPHSDAQLDSPQHRLDGCASFQATGMRSNPEWGPGNRPNWLSLPDGHAASRPEHPTPCYPSSVSFREMGGGDGEDVRASPLREPPGPTHNPSSRGWASLWSVAAPSLRHGSQSQGHTHGAAPWHCPVTPAPATTHGAWSLPMRGQLSPRGSWPRGLRSPCEPRERGGGGAGGGDKDWPVV